ncbi:MAG: hypothetical protein P1U57_02825 [Oleibacter sp.]|nr:hypothetical protein [Thalassolituus sp.]MDF1868576.1 hypothetical protein [Saprospiraceae bacterium]
MSVTLGKQIELLCKKIAKDYEGWEYSAKSFKNKSHKHTDMIVNMLWTGSPISISFQPVVIISNKKIEKIWKKYIVRSVGWTQFLRIMNPEDTKLQYRARIKDIKGDNAEEYIREVLNIGIHMLEENWDFSSEENLLCNLPVNDSTLPKGEAKLLCGDLGTRYCIAKILLGDFEYIERFYYDEIETPLPKRKDDLEKIMQHIHELRSAYEKKGKLFV